MRVHVGLVEAVKSGTAKSDDTEQPIPGLGDVCGHLSDAQKCSPAICNMKPHTRVQLEAKVYYIDREVLLPEGAQLIGAGVNKTRIVACGEPSSGRRTLVLNNDSYAGHFSFQGKSASRGNFEGAVGTPGCLSTTCAPAGLAGAREAPTVSCFLRGGLTINKCFPDGRYNTWAVGKSSATEHQGLNCYPGHGSTWGTGDLTTPAKHFTVTTCEAACRSNPKCDAVTVGASRAGAPACIPPDGDYAGVQNATAEYIHVDGYVSETGKQRCPLSTDAFWAPKTLAWGADRKTGSRNITVRGLTAWGTWADGIKYVSSPLAVACRLPVADLWRCLQFSRWPSRRADRGQRAQLHRR